MTEHLIGNDIFVLNFPSYEKTAEKNLFKDVPAWLSLILAAHRVPLRGVRRESPSW